MTNRFQFLTSEKLRKRLKQLGWIGFLFFLIKGLLWIIVPIILVYFGIEYEW